MFEVAQPVRRAISHHLQSCRPLDPTGCCNLDDNVTFYRFSIIFVIPSFIRQDLQAKSEVVLLRSTRFTIGHV